MKLTKREYIIKIEKYLNSEKGKLIWYQNELKYGYDEHRNYIAAIIAICHFRTWNHVQSILEILQKDRNNT